MLHSKKSKNRKLDTTGLVCTKHLLPITFKTNNLKCLFCNKEKKKINKKEMFFIKKDKKNMIFK